MKGGLWEGGVRGTGFIWSPLLRQSGYVSQHLIHVSDWLPTLLSAAGYDAGKLTGFLDGIDQWESLSENLPTTRTEILLNSDSLENSSAILVGGMKLLHANYGFTVNCRHWYMPNQEAALEVKCEMKDEVVRNMENSDPSVDLNYKPTLIENVVDQEKENSNLTTGTFQTGDNLHENMFPGNDSSWYFEQINQINQILLEMGKNRNGKRQTLIVRCGIRPADVLTNCLPWIRPCLYNITIDPCEYRNLAELMPDVASRMLEKLEHYKRNANPPIVMPVDENGFPYLNGGNWVPWIKPTDSSVKSDL